MYKNKTNLQKIISFKQKTNKMLNRGTMKLNKIMGWKMCI